MSSIEQLYNHWQSDVAIDETEIAKESIKIPSLHHKYMKMLTEERIKCRSLEADMKRLKLEKYEFYTQGPTKEQAEKGWRLPPSGLILKSDIPLYMDSDEDIIQLSIKIGIQQEKIELLESIIKTLMNRSYILSNALAHMKFVMGG